VQAQRLVLWGRQPYAEYMDARERITMATLRGRKRAGRKFSVLTCYDAPTARIMEAAGVEVLLVGDTSGEVVLGLPSTRETPVDYLLTITAAVRRGAPNAYVMADMPHACRLDGDAGAVEWAQRFMSQTGCDGVKVEVKADEAGLIRGMSEAGVPVVAHLGLLPQLIDRVTGYRAQARDAQSAAELIHSAREMEAAGAVCLLLEAVASEVAGRITAGTELPVIGCVSGPRCDGTVVVLHDMLAWGGGHPPRAVKQYENLGEVLGRAFAAYVEDIHAGRFPIEEESIQMRPGEARKLAVELGEA
jgi:3-methyl-2-oxobutanoate hydroxymethyltransferase